jgi:RNA polymerase sigma-70 factor (ECF subfamily)
MFETSISLLDRLRCESADQDWRRLVDLYTPLIRGWLQREQVRPQDVEDLVQEVLSVVVREMPRFEHSRRTGAFRCWLRTITVHRLRDFWRLRRGMPEAVGDSDFLNRLDQFEDPDSDLSRQWDEEHDRFVVGRLLQLMEAQFEPSTVRAFRGVMLEGRSAAEVAESLGLSVNAVLLAKSRVLQRLRQEARGLVD